MAKYIVEQMATVWYQVEVEADTKEQALDLGQDKLNQGEGWQNQDSFEFQDEFWVSEGEEI